MSDTQHPVDELDGVTYDVMVRYTDDPDRSAAFPAVDQVHTGDGSWLHLVYAGHDGRPGHLVLIPRERIDRVNIQERPAAPAETGQVHPFEPWRPGGAFCRHCDRPSWHRVHPEQEPVPGHPFTEGGPEGTCQLCPGGPWAPAHMVAPVPEGMRVAGGEQDREMKVPGGVVPAGSPV